MILAALLSLLALVLITLYYISRWKYDYWRKRNVPHLTPTTVFGNYGRYIRMKQFIGSLMQDILQQYPNEPYVGAFYGTEPVLIIQDPELLKLVTTKDFYYFHGREITKYTDREVVTKNLFFQGGDSWKVNRQNLTPLFSSAKMKKMFYLIEKCAIEFEKVVDNEFSMSNNIDMRSVISKFTMACICSCAFGVDIDTLGQDAKDNRFIMIGKIIFENSYIRGFLTITRAIWPAIFYGLGFTNFPDKLVQFFNNFLTKVFEGRQYKATNRHDFIDMMLQLRENKYIVGDSIRNSKDGEDKKIQVPVTDQFMVAQCMVFFAAGFETSATTLTYTLFELAKHPEALKKVQEDVDAFLQKHENKLVYDCVTELPYAEMCIDETLRLYPVLALLAREVMEDYVFPTGLKVTKGMRVHIPVYHLHHHPKYFREPEKFRPERFSTEERRNIVPHTYIPFGDGSRICIGMRFAKMQMLSGLVTLLKKYNVELAEGMPTKLEFDPRSIVTQPFDAVKLKFTPREGWEQRVFAK